MRSKLSIALLAALFGIGHVDPRGTDAQAAEPVDLAKIPPAATQMIDFARDIFPIFQTHCVSCHGPTKQEADFRLDVREVVLEKGGALGPALVPGKSRDSLLIHLVSGARQDLVMPLKGARLTGVQIGLLRAWIDQGADWPKEVGTVLKRKEDHWAFHAPVRPPLPSVKKAGWVRNPIDAFILSRLEKEGLAPSPEASSETLLRRLALDLTGLPPTLTEIDGYLTSNPLIRDRQAVERLLASPHYGERWGRHWLDSARYADSNGYEKDAARNIWPYRDYVIGAFNRDLPLDQFTVEQIAGDLLPNPTREQKVATGFLRNSMINQEGGIEPEQFRVEALIDRMDAIGRTWLGLTVACAQCHNHKFDPISQRDYFRLLAFINNDEEPWIDVPTPAEETLQRSVRERASAVDVALMNQPEVRGRFENWLRTEKERGPVPWQTLVPTEWHNFAAKYEKLPDGSLLGGGDLKPGAVLNVWFETPLSRITALQIEALLHPGLPYNGPGLVGKGSFLVKEVTVQASSLKDPTQSRVVKFKRAAADLAAPGFEAATVIDGERDKGGWTGALHIGAMNQERRLLLECEEPIGFEGGTKLHITVYQKHESMDGNNPQPDKESKLDSHAFGRVRFQAIEAAVPSEPDPLTAEQRLWLGNDKKTPIQTARLFEAFRQRDSALQEANQSVAAIWKEWPYSGRTLALMGRSEVRPTRVFKRGDWQRPGDVVTAGVPALLHPLPDNAPADRLSFARWLVDRRSPTTARVIVNRVWQQYFGQGLVTTPEDFGTRVEAPSHPELLDWLACEFMDRGWSFKELHRLITSSATYRQSSRVSEALLDKDPYNRWIARFPRLRVEAEIVQDLALFSSGLLSLKVGGPSVKPPMPPSLTETAFGGFSWVESQGGDRYRRGLYTFWKRSVPFPTLSTFDAPNADSSCTRRLRSNTPLQALVTLNEGTYVEAARRLARRVLEEGVAEDENARLRRLFRLCTSRGPDAYELTKLQGFLEEQRKVFALDPGASQKVLARTTPEEGSAEQAAWVLTARAVLNLDETFTRP